MSTHACKGCGKGITWGWYHGRHIPIDQEPAIFRLERGLTNGAQNIELASKAEYAVNHLAVCPNAKVFAHPKRSAVA